MIREQLFLFSFACEAEATPVCSGKFNFPHSSRFLFDTAGSTFRES